MNWQAVIETLRRKAEAQKELVDHPYKHPDVKAVAATVFSVLTGIADALEAGVGEDNT